MSWLANALTEIGSFPKPDALDSFRRSIDPSWIEQALAATGTATLRKRRLPAEQVIWLVLGMALMRDLPIARVVSRLDLAMPKPDGNTDVAPSSIAQARQRVGDEPLQWLFDRCANAWAQRSARARAWRGRSLWALDGTTLRVADSDENREHFGLANGGHRGDSGYPLVRMVVLMAVRSHLAAAASFGEYSRSEHALAESLWSHIPDVSPMMSGYRPFASASSRQPAFSVTSGGELPSLRPVRFPRNCNECAND